MALYKVIDDYLPKHQYEALYNYMTSYEINWKFIPYITHVDNQSNEGSQFCIPIQSDTTGLYDPYRLYAPILNKLNTLAFLRVKANLTTQTERVIETQLHVDYNFPCVTAIYYINTCNGYTHFEDGSKIDSVANRFVMFPSSTKHGGSTTSDQRFRMVINFNYHPS